MSRFHEELYRKKGKSHDDLVIRCVSWDGLKKILLDSGIAHKYPEFRWDYETEAVCANPGYRTEFIIGYADIVLTGHLPGGHAYDTVRVIVEVKPTLDDIGSTVRQLKTYERCKSGGGAQVRKVIVTYSQISDEIRDYLIHEGVSVVVFEGE